MRPKVVVAILFVAFAVAAAVILLRPGSPPPATVAPAEASVTPAVPDNSTDQPLPAIPPPVITNVPMAAVVPPSAPGATPAVSASDRVAQLMALAMNDDSNSFNTIWAELSNPDQEIRAGALAAVVQFGDHSVAPRLRTLADQTEDPTEKASILDAANFLALPTLTGLRTNAPAAGR